MQKVIGLDIGSYSIKAVEILNTFKTYEIIRFYEVVLPYPGEGESQDAILSKCLRQLFEENKLEADRIVTAIPGQYISSRMLPIAFTDPRKIEMALFSEIEDLVPFDLEEMIIDHQILSSSQGKTAVMVVMTKKSFLKNFLDHLQSVKIDPKLIDVDSLAFYNLASYLPVLPDQTVATVDIGHEKTSVCIVQNGVLKMFRTINLGGLFLSEFLARDLEVDLATAQQIKHRVSRVLCEGDTASDLSAEDRLVAERMTLAANAIVKELGRTFYAFKTWDRSTIHKIFLSGGSAAIKNIDVYLAEQLETSLEINRLSETTLKLAPELEPYMLIMPQSVSIGMRAVLSVKKLSQVNLRKGEFAFVQNYEQILKWVALGAKAIAFAFFVLTVSYGVKRVFYASQIDELEKQYLKEYGALLPGKKKPAAGTPFAKIRSEAQAQIKRDVESRKQAVDDFVATHARTSSIEALQKLSEAIPKTVKVDLTLYSFALDASQEGKLVLQGETPGYASVASFVEALKKSPDFSNVEEKQSAGKPGTDNKVIQFTVNAVYKGSAKL